MACQNLGGKQFKQKNRHCEIIMYIFYPENVLATKKVPRIHYCPGVQNPQRLLQKPKDDNCCNKDTTIQKR